MSLRELSSEDHMIREAIMKLEDMEDRLIALEHNMQRVLAALHLHDDDDEPVTPPDMVAPRLNRTRWEGCDAS